MTEERENKASLEGIDERGPLSWPDFFHQIETFSEGWFFRGHQCASWDLKTSLERHTPTDRKPLDAESYLLQEFRSRADVYLTADQVPTTIIEWLALMQHFGAPTRLLDITKSPYVAAYFAIEDATPDEDCAVWAVHESWCYESAGKIIAAGKPEWSKETQEHIDTGRLPRENLHMTLGFTWSWGIGKVDTDQWLRESVPLVLPGFPDKLSERMSIQQGGFLVPRAVDLPFMENLKAFGNAKGRVVKLIIRSSDRPRALEQLRLMNITRASLFPGLDGFAQSFRQLLIRESVEEEMKRTRSQLALDGLIAARDREPRAE